LPTLRVPTARRDWSRFGGSSGHNSGVRSVVARRMKVFGFPALGVGLLTGFAAGCGGSDQKILPAPTLSDHAGASAMQPDSNAGSGGSGVTGSCPSYAPDRCGDGAATTCVSLQTDAEHCGACDHACAAQSACAAGACAPVPEELTTSAGCGEP